MHEKWEAVLMHATYNDWVVFLRSIDTKQVIFRDVTQANLLAWNGKTKPNRTKAHIHQSKHNTK